MAPTARPPADALATLNALTKTWTIKATETTQRRFGFDVANRLENVEAAVVPLVEAPERLEARIVSEVTVTEEMCQGYGTLHGACAAYLIDVGSTFAILLLDYTMGGAARMSVSQSLNITYHAPALPGAKLRLVSTTLALGARSMSARTEIWDATNGRLVASGVHVKMEASAPKKAKL